MEGPRRRSDSISPSIFPSDPDPFQRTKISPPANPAVETTPKAGSVSLLKTTSNSRSNRSSSLISSKTRLDSPGASNVYQPTGDRSTERTPLLGPGTGTGTKVDPDGIGVGVGGTPDMGRRRSSTATAIKRRKANEVGQSTNGQTVSHSRGWVMDKGHWTARHRGVFWVDANGLAVQCDRSTGGYRSPLTAACIRLRRLVRGYCPLIRLRIRDLSHVSRPLPAVQLA